MQWRDKVGTYAHFFRKMYGKISKNFDFFYLKMLFFWLQIIFEAPFLAWWFHLMSHTNVTWEFLRFWNFCPFWGPRSRKNWHFSEKSQFFDLLRPKNGPKNQNLKKSQVTFVKLIKWDHYAKNWAPRVIWSQKNNFSRTVQKRKVNFYADFSIHFRRKVRVGANFDES